MPRRYLILAFAICATLLVVRYAIRTSAWGREQFDASIQGSFVTDGSVPAVRPSIKTSPRIWTSWVHSGNDTGTLRLGPFPAPPRLRFEVAGYPSEKGIEVFLELEVTKDRIPLHIENSAQAWINVDVTIPSEWRGWRISLVAVDEAKGDNGWLALTEPFGTQTGGARDYGLIETLCAWATSGLVLGLFYLGAIRWVSAWTWIDPAWTALVSWGWVALLGYVAFWAYFAHPILGKIFTAVLFGWSLWSILRRPANLTDNREWLKPTLAMLAIGLFYLALLHLYETPRDFPDLASNRFVAGLPGDNRIPHAVADRLYQGLSPKKIGDWLSSDRPPLQSGWLLLTWPISSLLGLSENTASGTAGVWFQLLWIPAAYGLLRGLGLSSKRSLAWVVVISFNGFFLLHSVFTWPKLSAGALVCGTFGLWLMPSKTNRREQILIGAALAGLGWLSHGGIAFSLIALLPWIGWRCIRGETKSWIQGGLVFFAVALPWSAYQRFYEPPGNRLLKWHLGGQIAVDSRGIWQTLREAYGGLTWTQIIDYKLANFRTTLDGNWKQILSWDYQQAAGRSTDEFYHLFHALTFWNLGIPLLFTVLGFAALGKKRSTNLREPLVLFTWVLGTLLIWCVMMFGPGQTVIHQGSFAMMIAFFVSLSVFADRFSFYCLPIFASLQLVSLLMTWAPRNSVVSGTFSRASVVLASAALIVSVGWIARASLEKRRELDIV